MVTLALHKPYGMLSRFTPDGSPNRTLAELGLPKDVWPIGRLDADSEGLLLLSSDKRLVDRLLSPKHKAEKTYWVQVERIPDDEALLQLCSGVVLDGERTLPARAVRIEPPPVASRDPPIRFRKSVPDCWIALTIVEGKNRQVRRMTAAVGHPTLRLVRHSVGNIELGTLAAGEHRIVADDELAFVPGHRERSTAQDVLPRGQRNIPVRVDALEERGQATRAGISSSRAAARHPSARGSAQPRRR